MARAPVRALVLTVSDSRSRGERRDLSGPAVARMLKDSGFEVAEPLLVADDQPAIKAALVERSAEFPLIVTTGGTGIAPRDVTPEATRAVCERVLDGFGERMRSAGREQTSLASLSRAVAGTRGRTLIVNLPGSPQGAVASLAAVLDLIPHALSLLSGAEAHLEHATGSDTTGTGEDPTRP
ncbi:MAG: MogA/MoaB family molybdenum cofactor biosynthesis protein [Acidobacteriaceae bacterium]